MVNKVVETCCLSDRLHGVITQKTVISVKISNPNFKELVSVSSRAFCPH
jgi:hypothetical protein